MNINTLYNSPIFIKVIATVGIIVGGFIIKHILKTTLNRSLTKFIQKEPQKILFNKLIKWIILVIMIISTLAVWVKDPWTFIIGILAVLSIGFVAVWSILSNLLAGILILMSKPFQIHDKISILPDDITGVVSEYNLFFIVVTGEDNSTISIPNNMIFQKIIKKFP